MEAVYVIPMLRLIVAAERSPPHSHREVACLISVTPQATCAWRISGLIASLGQTLGSSGVSPGAEQVGPLLGSIINLLLPGRRCCVA